MSEIDKLVSSVARAYLAVRGDSFTHLGVQLPLNQEVLTMAIQNNIVGAHLEHAGGKQGREDALLMLRHMVAGETLTPLGAVMLDEMNKAFCADVRQMLNDGKDPVSELARECERRATQ
ncbi:hypothetical protein [Aeromonas caviae]|uniref:Uncharacterized protein n=2 Tax=Aeromonas caviae TaxID=648 RepID=A0AAI9P900_AERCA|nr:hypothetical protein [Aeromonas caviae]GJA15079.1 hypothetical protein KAM335_22750 [Aeromonas caviae]GJA18878.1 hypothetical protein KAM336_18990 [Aeromonas caviae]GJA23773.1 hypothetical protein KAM337_23010 [Aeromonas caviae]GJA27479.1 hypothetical protein KAM340_16460 [Aeromonas caviae]GJA54030.1 hypothetical protein KAM348_14530 [Aeromonas caviae]